MLGSFADVVDRRLANVMVARARRRWPLLIWVPERWLQPLVWTVAVRLRRSLVSAGAATMAFAAVVFIAVLI